MNDTLKLMMYGRELAVPKDKIVEIKSGKALTTTDRWFDIICNVCLTDYEQVNEDDIINGSTEPYIVCNKCNKVTYIKDLRP